MLANGHKTILLLSVFLNACVQSGTVVNAGAPDWLQGEAAHYPDTQYVVASGSASDAETAQKRAQANLAKVFELRIRESTTTTQDVQSTKQAGLESVSSRQRIDSQINVSTDKLIAGARIAEQWQDPDDRTWYALAVLDRQQAGNSMRSEIERLDADTEFQLSAAQIETDRLRAVALWQRAISSQEQRAALQKSLKVIDLLGRGMAAQWSRVELSAGLQQALNALPLQAVVKQDSIAGLTAMLRAALAQAGFAASDATSAYRLVLELSTQPSFQQQNWYWQRATLNLQLELEDGSVRGQKSWPLKVSASRPEQLAARLRASVEHLLKTELGATVLGFAGAD